MKNKFSILNKNNCPNEFVDVLILGDNLTSINTAYHLKDTHLKIGILSSNNNLDNRTDDNVNMSILQNIIYTKLLKSFSKKHVKMYLNAQICAMNELIDIVNKNKIDCDLKKVPTYLFSNKINTPNILEKERKLLLSMGIKIKSYNNVNSCDYAIYTDKSLSFNLNKYILFLKNICLQSSVKLFLDTKIFDIKKKDNKYICKTNKGVVFASKLVITGNEFHDLLPISLYFKTYKYDKYIFTNDLLPIVGYANPQDTSFLISFAYNEQKIENSFLASIVLKDLILEQENEYVPLLAINRQTKLYHLLHLLPVFYYKFKNIMNYKQNKFFSYFKLKTPKLSTKFFNYFLNVTVQSRDR